MQMPIEFAVFCKYNFRNSRTSQLNKHWIHESDLQHICNNYGSISSIFHLSIA